jgi:hypothetical protein
VSEVDATPNRQPSIPLLLVVILLLFFRQLILLKFILLPLLHPICCLSRFLYFVTGDGDDES